MLPVAVSVAVPRPRAAVQPRLHNALLVELLFDLLLPGCIIFVSWVWAEVGCR